MPSEVLDYNMVSPDKPKPITLYSAGEEPAIGKWQFEILRTNREDAIENNVNELGLGLE